MSNINNYLYGYYFDDNNQNNENKQVPTSPSERVVKKGIDILDRNIEEIRKLKEEIDNKDENKSDN